MYNDKTGRKEMCNERQKLQHQDFTINEHIMILIYKGVEVMREKHAIEV